MVYCTQNEKKDGLAGKYKMLSVEKNNSRLSSRWESILFSSVWNDCFHTVNKQLRVETCSSSSSSFSSFLCHISSPSSGRLVFQFLPGCLLLRPSGICSAAHSAFIWTSSRESGRQQPLFPSSCTIPPGPPCVVHFFFYFEVEFPHLCLTWRKKDERRWAKT